MTKIIAINSNNLLKNDIKDERKNLEDLKNILEPSIAVAILLLRDPMNFSFILECFTGFS